MVKSIPNAFIDELVSRVDIVDVIDRRVPLTKKGKEYMACCPFHDERTPSFSVSPDKQFYHCFGCGAHGTAIGFLMGYANLGFVEAVEELAEGIGLIVPTGQTKSTADGQSINDLLTVISQANSWFQQQLRSHPQAKQAISYLKKRGLDGQTAAKFGIGFVPDSWNELTSALGYSDRVLKQLQKAGLINQRENQNTSKNTKGKGDKYSYYDRFRNRIMFPIEDYRGRVVGFGGRVMGEAEPKYLNSPETLLFHKGAELYGLHRARRAIGVEEKTIVVEGYMDVIGLVQNGIENTVATLGTATTRKHLQRLFRLASEIVFCFDGDRAGRDAAWKSLQVVLPELIDGRQVSYLFLPDEEDPDSMVRKHGKQGFKDRVIGAVPLPDLLLDTLKQKVDMTRMDGKAKLVSLARPLVARLPNGALKDMMNNKLSSLSGVETQRLKEMFYLGKTQPTRRPSEQPFGDNGQIPPLAFATSLLLQNPHLAGCISERFPLEQLDIKGIDVFLQLVSIIGTDTEYTTARLLEACRESSYHSYLSRLAVRSNDVDAPALSSQFEDTLRLLFSQQIKQKIDFLIEKSHNQGLQDDEKHELNELLKCKKNEMS